MKNILVPTDFSEHSIYAVDVAVDLAKKNGATIFLLHCVELPRRFVTESTSVLPEELFFMREASNNVKKLSLELQAKGVEVKTVVETSTLTNSVKTLLEKESIDFIVMGSTGATGSKELFLGSNAEKIVRTSSVPVLVIKDKTNINEVKKIVFACDFSQKYIDAFQKAISFAQVLGAKIDFVYINTPYHFNSSREIKVLIDSFSTEHKEILSHNIHMYSDLSIEEGIIHFAEDHQSDLICMFPARQSVLMHLFNGSISEDIVNHSQKPVLTIKL
jgi:uspA domain protein